MKTRGSHCLAIAAGMMLCLCVSGSAPALMIQFNYDYDTQRFFNPAVNPYATQARAALENAGQNYEMFTDDLLEIVPGGINTWSARFTNPSTGVQETLPCLVVPADTMIVFVGGRNTGASLGVGGPGGYSASGTQDWLNTVSARGQAGALLSPKQDFGPWGGSISFSNTTTWNYGLASGPANNGQNDFFSTCLHELAHVLGFGLAGSWTRLVNSSSHLFLGPSSEGLYGGPVPLDSGNAHWANGTQGLSGGQAQEAEMDPTLTTGTRKRLTTLDVAALLDIGWKMPATGDANLDGIVDAADYVILKRDFAGPRTATWTDGDFDFDGAVTRRDLAALEANFGAVFSTQPAQAPEPATLTLLAAGCLAIRRRRKVGPGSWLSGHRQRGT